MKNKFNTVFFIGILCTVSLLHGQVDTNDVLMYEEQIDTSDYYYKSKYRYLDINLKEDRSLVKFGLFPFIPGGAYQFGTFFFQAAYESKIGKQFSVVREFNVETLFGFDNNQSVVVSGIGLSARYYPGMKRRINEGISGDNVNGIYFSFSTENIFQYMILRESHEINGTSKNSYLEFSPDFFLTGGFQKRLTRLFYIDARIYTGYLLHDNSFTGGAKILLGMSFNPTNVN